MDVGNRNLFVTNSECGVEEKQMDRETMEYQLLSRFPNLTCLNPLDKPFNSFQLFKRASTLYLVSVIQFEKLLIKQKILVDVASIWQETQAVQMCLQ